METVAGAERTDEVQSRLERAITERLTAGAEFFEKEAPRIARCCHQMAERFARDGRLIALGTDPASRSDARHVSVEFVHPVIVGKRALPAIALTGEGGPLGPQLEGVIGPDDIVIGFGLDDPGRGGGETVAALAQRRRARLHDDRLRPGRSRRRARLALRGAGGRSLRPPGADRDPVPRALGAGPRLLRPPRPARGPQRALGPRHRRLELPLPVPLRGRGRPRSGARPTSPPRR